MNSGLPRDTCDRVHRFGVCGWDYADWRGPIYPERASRNFRGLPLLAQFTDFMEVNATFYHPMGGDRAVRWLDETPDPFTFVVKAYRGWTHDGAPPEGSALTAFREIIDPMLERDRLEGVLAQYPPSLRVRNGQSPNLRSIERLAKALAPARIFVEVRDRSLYEPAFFRFLEERNIGFVNVDLPNLGTLPSLSTVNTGPVGYTRLHGRSISGWKNPRATRDERYDHLYVESELDAIVDSLVTLAARVPRILIAANNHFRAQAPAAIVALRSRLETGP
ncbi:MAG: DUF72 domain-containing protein, partial [Planctomycetota bacterium]